MNAYQPFYTIPDLIKYKSNQSKTSLLGNGFLNRKGSAMIVGPAGVGKSKFMQHLAMSMALGLDFLDIKVNAKTRVLLIQAEDAIDDIAESLQGFFHHTVGGDMASLAGLESNLFITTVDTLVGADFVKLVDQYCEVSKPDVVIIDPLVAFMGCDLVDQGAVTKFLRQDLGSIMHRHNCALMCVHHTKRDKGGPMVERAFGGMEFSAFFRGIIDLCGDSTEYRNVRVRVTKRQRQLGLKDLLGNPIDSVNIKMGKDAVYWTKEDQPIMGVESGAGGRPPKVPKAMVDETIATAKAAGLTDSEIIKTVTEKHPYSKKQASRFVKEAAPTGKKKKG